MVLRFGLLGVESGGVAACCELSVERSEVGVRALGRYEAQLHQLAHCVVDQHQERTRIAALLEPSVVAAIDLDQRAIALAPQS